MTAITFQTAKMAYDPDHLQKLHPVAYSDSHIYLNEDTHIYYVDNIPYPGSVTGFVKDNFPKFDADSIIQKMMSGKSWGPKHKYYGKTPEEIKAEWSSNDANNEGTIMHAKIEKFYNIPELYSITDRRVSSEELSVYFTAEETEVEEFQQFLDFHHKFIGPKGWIPWRTELKVFDDALQLAGSIDMIYTDAVPTPNSPIVLHIVDWKRSKEIKTQSFYNRETGWVRGLQDSPCQDLMDCNYIHYSLQVNTYAAMLLRALYPAYTIGEMYLGVFHPNYTQRYVDEVLATKKRKPRVPPSMPIGFQVYEVTPMRQYIEAMMAKRLEQYAKVE